MGLRKFRILLEREGKVIGRFLQPASGQQSGAEIILCQRIARLDLDGFGKQGKGGFFLAFVVKDRSRHS